MSGSVRRSNLKSTTHTGNRTIPATPNRSYFFITFTTAAGTIELGGGGGKVPIAQGAFFEPYITPTSEIIIETTGDYVLVEG